MAIGALGFALSLHFGLIGGPQFTEGLVVSERPMSLNPLVDASDPAVVDVGHLLYRSLLRLDPTGYPAPDLASSYAVSADGRTYTVVLPDDLEWSNGQPITPADVAATCEFALSRQAGDPTVASALAGVVVSGQGSAVTFTLPAPRASFAATLTELPILPLGALGESAFLSAVGHPTTPLPSSGAYEVASSGALAIVLRPNPHAARRPDIASYELRLFLTFKDAESAFAQGNVNALLATTPEELSTLLTVKGAQAESMTTLGFVDLMFNERVPGLSDSVVRHAIGVAIDRAAVVTGALEGSGGVVQTSPFSRGLQWVGASHVEATSPSAADAVLQGEGWAPGSDGTRQRGTERLAFTLSVPSIDPLPSVATEVAAQLGTIGIRVTVRTVPPAGFLSDTLATGDYQLAIDSWSPNPDPDVSAFWRSNAVPPHGYNVSGAPVDPFLDAALDVLAMSSERSARTTAAGKVTTLVAEDAPAVFLYTPEVSLVFRAPMPYAPIPSIGNGSARYDDIGSWQLR